MSAITIISNQISPRLIYVCDVIFKDFLDTTYTLKESVESTDNMTIIYGQKCSDNSGFFIPCSGLLEQQTIAQHKIDLGEQDELPFLYSIPNALDADLPFDLFSMCFFLLTRYEEHLPTPRDAYGRYQSKFSLAVKEKFLDRPILDLWIKRFTEKLNSRFGSSFSLSGTYNTEVTMDIDLPYAFRSKGMKTYLGILRDVVKLDFKTALHRTKFWFGGDDPFNTYQWLRSFCSTNHITPQIFILNKYKKPYDENHLADTDELGKIIKLLDSFADVGIHPSLSADNVGSNMKGELDFVEKCLEKRIVRSRQHFLQLDIKRTYKALIECGIKHDYSMGYPDVMGFRAGTSRPYKFYDLTNEKKTELIIHPCITMDVTMKKYLRLTPQEAIHKCAEMVKEIKEMNGSFSFIWHNSSLTSAYGWEGWREVFIHLSRL